MKKTVFLFFLLHVSPIVGADSTGFSTTSGGSTAVERVPINCTAEQIQANRDIINKCQENWADWTTDPWPPPDVRKENECTGSTHSPTAAFLRGCTKLALALPYAMLSLIMPDTPVSPYYSDRTDIFARGNEAQIVNYFDTQVAKEMCQLYHSNSPEYQEWKQGIINRSGCRWNAGGFTDCSVERRTQAEMEFRAPRNCAKSAAFQDAISSSRSYNQTQAKDIIAKREALKKLADEKDSKLSRINLMCGAKRYGFSDARSIGALALSAINMGWQQVLPSQRSVDRFNSCVKGVIGDDKEFEELLIKTTTGFYDKIAHTFDRFPCYNRITRDELRCELASAFVGSAGGAAAVTIRKLATKGAKRFSDAVIQTAKKVMDVDHLRGFPPETRRQKLKELNAQMRDMTDAEKRAFLDKIGVRGLLDEADWKFVSRGDFEKILGRNVTDAEMAELWRIHKEIGGGKPYEMLTAAERQAKYQAARRMGLSSEEASFLVRSGRLGSSGGKPSPGAMKGWIAGTKASAKIRPKTPKAEADEALREGVGDKVRVVTNAGDPKVANAAIDDYLARPLTDQEVLDPEIIKEAFANNYFDGINLDTFKRDFGIQGARVKEVLPQMGLDNVYLMPRVYSTLLNMRNQLVLMRRMQSDYAREISEDGLGWGIDDSLITERISAIDAELKKFLPGS